jgi:hypothetical protein
MKNNGNGKNVEIPEDIRQLLFNSEIQTCVVDNKTGAHIPMTEILNRIFDKKIGS